MVYMNWKRGLAVLTCEIFKDQDPGSSGDVKKIKLSLYSRIMIISYQYILFTFLLALSEL